MNKLRTTILSLAALGLTAAAATPAVSSPSAGFGPEPIANDSALPQATLQTGVYDPSQPPSLEQAQFWGGHRYCWSDSGWHGPGFYWCGYAWRRGFGWGGGAGWHGWHGGGHWGGHGGGHWGGHGGGGHWGGHSGHGGGGHWGGHGGGGHGGGGHGGHHH